MPVFVIAIGAFGLGQAGEGTKRARGAGEDGLRQGAGCIVAAEIAMLRSQIELQPGIVGGQQGGLGETMFGLLQQALALGRLAEAKMRPAIAGLPGNDAVVHGFSVVQPVQSAQAMRGFHLQLRVVRGVGQALLQQGQSGFEATGGAFGFGQVEQSGQMLRLGVEHAARGGSCLVELPGFALLRGGFQRQVCAVGLQLRGAGKILPGLAPFALAAQHMAKAGMGAGGIGGALQGLAVGGGGFVQPG